MNTELLKRGKMPRTCSYSATAAAIRRGGIWAKFFAASSWLNKKKKKRISNRDGEQRWKKCRKYFGVTLGPCQETRNEQDNIRRIKCKQNFVTRASPRSNFIRNSPSRQWVCWRRSMATMLLPFSVPEVHSPSFSNFLFYRTRSMHCFGFVSPFWWLGIHLLPRELQRVLRCLAS